MSTPSPAALAGTTRPTAVSNVNVAQPKFRHKRSEIWMVTADPDHPPVGTELWSNRPGIIISNDVMNGSSGFAQVIYLSSSPRKRSGPTHIRIPGTQGASEVTALCEQIHTVDASRLQRKLGEVDSTHMQEIEGAIGLSLSLRKNPATYRVFQKWEEYIKLHGIDIAKEIDALAGNTTDQRVESLMQALTLIRTERDAYRTLYETATSLPRTDHDIADLVKLAN